MKKALLVVLALLLCLSVCACGEKETSDESKKDTAETTDLQAETTESDEPVVYQFGESVTTASGMFKFTPNADGFAAVLGNTMDETYLLPQEKAESTNPYAAEEGKVMMYFSAVVEKVGESKKNETFDLDFKVDFDNGYVFEDSTGLGYSSDKESWSSSAAVFEPLDANQTRYVRFCVEVPETVKNDYEKELLVIFTIEEEEYSFRVDTKRLADEEAQRIAAAEAEKKEKMTKVDDALATEIKNKLQGSWSWDNYGTAGTKVYKVTQELTFSGDTVYINTTNTLMNNKLSNQGTYYIAKGYIVMNFADGSQACMPYTYEGGEISISSEIEGSFYTA